MQAVWRACNALGSRHAAFHDMHPATCNAGTPYQWTEQPVSLLSALFATLCAAQTGASLAASTIAAGPAAVALASSPTADSMVSRMRAVLKRHQCGSEEEAVTVCMRQAAQAAAKPSVSAAGPGPCNSYINSLRYCQLQTQQHNYPVAPAFLY